MGKRLEILEKALKDMRESHRSQWDTYGSELCAGDMIRQEEELEKKIKKLKESEEDDLVFHCGGKDTTYNNLMKRVAHLKHG